MPTLTVNPTSNTTPDPAQGGNAVTGNVNTGHGSTITTQAGAGTATKSCIWTGFPATGDGGAVVSMTLKFDWTEDGSVIVGTGSASNSFRVQYSVNGGGAFTTVFQHADVVAPASSSSSVSITLPQDVTQVQVRDRMQATATADVSDSASITTSISNIRIEVVTETGQVVVMM
jgi:hypothetical protein